MIFVDIMVLRLCFAMKQEGRWEFPTVEGRRPLTIDLKLDIQREQVSESLPPRSIVVCTVGGTTHPCNEDYHYNIINDVTKNPALLPALHDLKARLTVSLAMHLPDALSGYPYQGELAPQDSSDGFSLHRRFDYRNWQNNGQQEDAALHAAFHAIRADIDAAVPAIQSLIDENRHLQLPVPPDEFAKMELAAKVAEAWTDIWKDVPPDAHIARRKNDPFFLG